MVSIFIKNCIEYISEKKDENASYEWSCNWRTWLKKKRKKKETNEIWRKQHYALVCYCFCHELIWIILHFQQLFDTGERKIKILIRVKDRNNRQIIYLFFIVTTYLGNNSYIDLHDNLILKNARLIQFLLFQWLIIHSIVMTVKQAIYLYMNTLIFLACFFSVRSTLIRIYTLDLRVWS